MEYEVMLKRKQILPNYNKGFTLLELMIVFAIIAILSAISIPAYIEYRDKSFCNSVESDVHNASLDATAYLVDHTNLQDYIVTSSSNTTNLQIDLDSNGVLTVSASDNSERCPKGNTYTIVSSGTSGSWQ